jgi:pimeloyl-ACP methyl ester carboxylesterase
MREEFVEVGGLRLCRCEWGPEDGHPVICLHGLLDQGLLWEPVAVRLAAAGFRVIAPDLRGHGRSDHVGPGGSYQTLDFIGDAVALVDRMLDRPFSLIGHSLGTVVASGLASLREGMVERLVLIEPVLPAPTTTDDVRDTMNTLVTYALEPPRHSVMPDRATAAARLRRAIPSLSSDFAKRLVERVTRQEGDGWVWRWDAVLQTRMSLNLLSGPLHRSAYLRLLAALQPPLTVVQGTTSAFNRPEDLEALRNAMPGARRLLLDGGHNLVLDNPEALGAALLQALGVGDRS